MIERDHARWPGALAEHPEDVTFQGTNDSLCGARVPVDAQFDSCLPGNRSAHLGVTAKPKP